MFIGLSKTLARFGGLRLGLGLRITKNNIWWALLALLLVCVMQMAWGALLVTLWLAYATVYGIYRGCRLIYQTIRRQ